MTETEIQGIQVRLDRLAEAQAATGQVLARLEGLLEGKVHSPGDCPIAEQVADLEASHQQQKGAIRTVLVALGIPTFLVALYTLARVIRGQ